MSAKKRLISKSTNVFIITVNVLFVLALFLGEFFYIRNSNERTRASNRQIFLNTNISLGSMTNNYLIGESHLCRSWANYLNNEAEKNSPKTMDEAITFVKESITDETVMGHIVYKTGSQALKGYSTKPKNNTSDNSVDYNSIKNDVFSSASEGMNISSSYMNPINISKSLAFYTEVKLVDPDDNTKQIDAYLLRVVLLSTLRNKWAFPSGSFNHLEVAIIDSEGKYILAGNSFYNDNFYEYYKSYNTTTPTTIEKLKNTITNGSGYITMLNHSKQRAFIAYSQINGIEDWTILTYLPLADINEVHVDWVVIGTIGAGLAMLFIIDLIILLTLNKSLKSAAAMADSANKAKTDFLSTMSHDIRTPMNAIVGLTTIARKNENNPESTKDALNKIESASNHLLTLINDILDISKVESGKVVMNPLSFYVVNTFENLINISQPMVKAKHIDFHFRVRNFTSEWLYADELRLSQIFNNLVSNALKYTDENGKVTVYVKEEESEKEGCIKLIFIVEDNGIGMSEEFISKLYTPFSRATDSRVNSIQGTGLGLAITKQMVDLMNGTIDCKSKLGEGTTFTVTLDIPLGEKPQEEVSLPQVDILIVDSDQITLVDAEVSIESLGANVDVASSEKEAMDKINSKDYKVVIIDWVDKEIDVLKLAKKLKNIDKSPIILVSTYDSSEIKLENKEDCFDGFVSKPYFRSRIYESIDNAIEGNKDNKLSEESEQVSANILIVEDNDINWEVVSTILEMYGCTCSRAENGKVAYELIKDQGNDCPYDLVFMDIQMPVMNGLDATRAIRKLEFEYAKNVPIVAMTADAFSENVAECLNAGMNGHIAKPIDPKLVLAEIRKVVSNKTGE